MYIETEIACIEMGQRYCRIDMPISKLYNVTTLWNPMFKFRP